MGNYNPARAGTYTLNSSIGAADTTLTLTSFADPVTNVPITMSTLNTTIAYATIAPKTSQSEIISFTGITQNSDGTATITGITRGLQFQYPFTASASYQLPHSGQSIFILSDAPQVFQEYVPINDNVTINGLVTFAQPPVGINPGGQPNASPTVLGVVQEATTLQVNSGCNTGSTGGVLFASPADLAASNYGLNLPTSNQKAALVGDSGSTTGSPNSANTYITQQGFQNEAEVFGTTTGCSTTNSYALSLSPALTAYQDGQKFVFKASFATTGSPNTATLNVNSLGAGNLIKNGSPGVVLASNDIQVGQIVEVVRGSPNFQMLSPIAFGPTKVTRFTGFTPSAVSTEQTIFTTTINANTVGIAGLIRVRTFVSASPGASDTYTIRLKFGGTTFQTLIITTPTIGGGSGVNAYGFLEAIISNNAANAQNIGLYLALAPNLNVSTGQEVPVVTTRPSDTTGTIDTTSNQTLTITVQTANSNQAVTFSQGIIEVIND